MDLNSKVSKLRYISEKYESKLNLLGIFTLRDLLTYFPRKYIDSSEITNISEIKVEDIYTTKLKLLDIKSVHIRGGRSIQNIKAEDSTGKILIQFFNQPYLINALKKNETYLLRGKAKFKGNKIYFYPSSYDHVKEGEESLHLGRVIPEYKLTGGVSKKWLRNRIKSLLDLIEEKKIALSPENILSEETLRLYVNEVHFPSEYKVFRAAEESLSILELANIHLKIKENLSKKKKAKSFFPVNIEEGIQEIINHIPFKLTEDQNKAVAVLVSEIKKKKNIDILLQGDVGSGKTILAFIISYLFAKENQQVVILAPTTILARQHYDNAVKLFKFNKDIKIDLVSSENKINLKSNIIIGTTAILHRKNDLFKSVELLIVDEQHRFGVVQREELLGKDNGYTHFINMTATPIPRTIAEMFFSEKSVITIKSKPKGRKPIKSFIVPKEKRTLSIKWIEKEVNKGAQVYWVCPLIEDSENSNSKSVETIYKEVKSNTNNARVEILHGKMKPKEKELIMSQFKKKEFDILISTTVIEVGVDISNASIMVIENAERFGLAGLHQIRGRVGRGNEQSYCFLFTDEEINSEAQQRLEYFVKTADGLKIAEYDLRRRGPGEVYGTKQSGIPNLKIADIFNIELIKKSKIVTDSAFKNGVKSIELFN